MDVVDFGDEWLRDYSSPAPSSHRLGAVRGEALWRSA
jgi:hypothetical protein